MNIQTVLKDFLQKYCDLSKPILLGLSGGPDSLCLFHLLLALQKDYPLNIHVAHINHRWRKESDDEARQLKELTEKHSLPFHLDVLDPASLKGNLEAACREKRLEFFSKICQMYGCQAVLLGHHADDQAETVLKRIFESGSVLRLAALQEKSLIGTLTILRPFLKIPKKSLIDWLYPGQGITSQHIHPFEDSTNLDPKFLRGKFRTQTIPALSLEFGKNIQEPLCQLSLEISELQDYLNAKVQPYIQNIVSTQMGLFLNLKDNCPNEKIEIKLIIRKFCEKAGFSLSHSQIETAIEIISTDTADKQMMMGNHQLFIDRRRLFIPSQKKTLHLPTETIPLIPGVFSYGIWKVHVEFIDCIKEVKKDSSWMESWLGNCWTFVPKDNLAFSYPTPSSPLHGRNKNLSRWWTDHKVPAFLRYFIPIIISDEGVYHEFLTGKSIISKQGKDSGFLVKLSIE